MSMSTRSWPTLGPIFPWLELSLKLLTTIINTFMTKKNCKQSFFCYFRRKVCRMFRIIKKIWDVCWPCPGPWKKQNILIFVVLVPVSASDFFDFKPFVLVPIFLTKTKPLLSGCLAETRKILISPEAVFLPNFFP